MKKMLLLSGALLVVCASVAAAAPRLNLAWDACVLDGGANLRTTACATNLNSGTNANILVPSVLMDADVAMFNGFDTHIIIGTATLLPAWWNCAGKVTATGSAANMPCTNDTYASVGGGGGVPLTGIDLYPNSNAMQIRFAFAVPEGSEQLLTVGEWPTCVVTISNAKTTGTGACAGCDVMACLRFNLVTLGQAGGIATDISLGGPGTANLAYWQSSAVSCATTPTRNHTWGAIKALYR